MFENTTFLDESDQPTLPSLRPLEKDAVQLRQVEVAVPVGKIGIARSNNLLLYCCMCIVGDISNVGPTSLICQRTGQYCGLYETHPDTGNITLSIVFHCNSV